MSLFASLLIIFILNYLSIMLYFARWRKKRYKRKLIDYDVSIDDLVKSDTAVKNHKSKKINKKGGANDVLCNHK